MPCEESGEGSASSCRSARVVPPPEAELENFQARLGNAHARVPLRHATIEQSSEKPERRRQRDDRKEARVLRRHRRRLSAALSPPGGPPRKEARTRRCVVPERDPEASEGRAPSEGWSKGAPRPSSCSSGAETYLRAAPPLSVSAAPHRRPPASHADTAATDSKKTQPPARAEPLCKLAPGSAYSLLKPHPFRRGRNGGGV